MTEAQAREIVELAVAQGADASVTRYTDPDNWGHLAILTNNPGAVFWAAGRLGFRFDRMPRNRTPLQSDWPHNWTRQGASFYLY
jgi:hypothetical protein